MTLKEQNIILGRLDKLQATVNYNNNLYRQNRGRNLQYIRRPLSGYVVWRPWYCYRAWTCW